MIQTKRDLKFYMTEDARALGYDKLPFFKRFIRVLFDKRIKFHIELRKFEYYSNKYASLGDGGVANLTELSLSIDAALIYFSSIQGYVNISLKPHL